MKRIKTFKESYNEGIKLVTYSTNGMMFEDIFKNLNKLNEYAKSCGGFKALGDYEIYTKDNSYRKGTRNQWELINLEYVEVK